LKGRATTCSTAQTTLSALIYKHQHDTTVQHERTEALASRGWEYGIGISAPVTRIGGASR